MVATTDLTSSKVVAEDVEDSLTHVVVVVVVVVEPNVPVGAVPTGHRAPLSPARAYTPSRIPSVCMMYGPLDDGGVPEECHSFLRALPEVLQCMYVMKILCICSAR